MMVGYLIVGCLVVIVVIKFETAVFGVVVVSLVGG